MQALQITFCNLSDKIEDLIFQAQGGAITIEQATDKIQAICERSAKKQIEEHLQLIAK
jgi:hypothetical protein